MINKIHFKILLQSFNTNQLIDLFYKSYNLSDK